MLKIRRNRKSRSKDNLFIVLWNFQLRNRSPLKKKKENNRTKKKKVKTTKMIMKMTILNKMINMIRKRKNFQIKKVNYLISLSCNMKKNIQRKLSIMNPLIKKNQEGKKMVMHRLKEDHQDQVFTIIMVRINGKRNQIENVFVGFYFKKKMNTKRRTRSLLISSSNNQQELILSHKADKELKIILNKRSSHCSTVTKYFISIS